MALSKSNQKYLDMITGKSPASAATGSNVGNSSNKYLSAIGGNFSLTPTKKSRKKRFDYNWQDFRRTPEGQNFLSSILKPATDFEIDAEAHRIDPFQLRRDADPLRAPLPPTSDVPIPAKTVEAIRAIPGGLELLDAENGYIPARRSSENLQSVLSAAALTAKDSPAYKNRHPINPVQRKMQDIALHQTESVAADNKTSAEKWNTWGAKSIGKFSMPGALSWGVVKQQRDTESGKTLAELLKYIAPPEGSLQPTSAEDNPRSPFNDTEELDRIKTIVFNIANGMRAGTASTLDAAGNLVAAKAKRDADIFAGKPYGGQAEAMDKSAVENAKIASTLEPFYNSDQGLTKYGWERDPNTMNFGRGMWGLAQDVAIDPTTPIGLGSTGAAKGAVREYAESAFKSSIANQARNALRVAARSGLDDAAGRALTKGATQRQIGQAMGEIIQAGDQPTLDAVRGVLGAKKSTVLDVVAGIRGVDNARFVKEVSNQAKFYGRSADDILAKDASRVGFDNLDKIDQKIIDNGIRRSHEGFGAIEYGGMQLPGSPALGRALSTVNQFDVVNKLKGGKATGSLADLAGNLNPFIAMGKVGDNNSLRDMVAEAGNGRLSEPMVRQAMAVKAAAERRAPEMAAHSRQAVEAGVRGQETLLGVPTALSRPASKTGSAKYDIADGLPGMAMGKKEFEKSAAIAGKYYSKAMPDMTEYNFTMGEIAASPERASRMAQILGYATPEEVVEKLPVPARNLELAASEAMKDKAAKGLDESVILRMMQDQEIMADTSEKSARERLLGLEPIEGYQPGRAPQRGRVKQSQKMMADVYGGSPNDYQNPIRGSADAARMKLDASRGDIRGQIDSGEGVFQKPKDFENINERGMASRLTETNPYRAFEQVQVEQDLLSSQEELLHTLASSFGKSISPEVSAKVDKDLVVSLQDGTRFLMPDGKTAQTVKDLVSSSGKVGDSGAITEGLSKVGQVINPLMTILRPAFTKINTLGNVALTAREGYARELPSAFSDLMHLAVAGGDVSKIKNSSVRELMEVAEKVGAVNPMSASPNMILDPAHPSALLRGGAKNPLNYVAKPNQIANGFSENLFRLSVFKEELARNGGLPEAARQRVDDILFNYDINALPPVLQHARKAMPFLNFAYRNVPATAQYFAKHPQRLATLNRIRTNFGSEENQDQAERLREQPPYLRDQTMFQSNKVKDVAGNDMGAAMTNVRLPDSEILRLLDTLEKVATGNDTEKAAAAGEYIRELVGPQYSMLSSLVSGYDDKGNAIASDEGYGFNLLKSMAEQTPMVGPAITAYTKQGKEPIRGGDESALRRFATNQLGMFPSTDYNPAAWERTSAIIGNEELKSKKSALEKPNAIAKLLGAQPLDIPQDSKERIDAGREIYRQRDVVDTKNKEASIYNEDVERVESSIQSYRKWRKGKADGVAAKYNHKPYAAPNRYELTNKQWDMLRTKDPEAYSFWKSRWKGKTGASKEQRMMDTLNLLTGGG